MSKYKVTIKQISEKEMYEGMSPKKMADLKKSMADIKFASKHGIEIFGGTYSHVPIPVHLLSKKLSKHDENIISGMVAMIVNEKQGQFARTVQYIHKMPKNDPNIQMIIKNSKYAEKRGKAETKILKNLWARKNKLKKHELFRLWLGV